MAKTFLITPGELESIGLEVTLKALQQLKTVEHSYIFYSQKDYLKKHIDLVKIGSEIKEIKSPTTDLKPGVYFINSSRSPVDWFKEACGFCSAHPNLSALITGPLIKKSFNDPSILGHTEYLRSIFPDHELFMTFFGEHYNCLLLNDHIPLSKVCDDISLEKIHEAYRIIANTFEVKQIGLLGLNPHAGEEGLLGNEEINIHNVACNKNELLEGPLSPDGFFNLESYQKYDFLIANYHDQGLIPFKVINGFKASQASLGLPFVRTSVDHGTSFDIFMKNKANPESMIHALKLANRLLTLKNNH